MRSIYYLITRFYVLIVFVLLEAFALTIIYKSNKYQEIRFMNTSNAVTGTISSYIHSAYTFIHSGTNNKLLLEENAALKQQIAYQNLYPIDTSFPHKSNAYTFDYIAAKIVNNTLNKSVNYITIDKGSIDGVQKGYGVISSNGVVGIITNVSEHFSLVMSVISMKTQIGIRHKNTNAIGSLFWNGENPYLLQVSGISKTLPIKKNDTLVTAGFSSIFPPNISVATVVHFEPEVSTSFYHIDVKLTSDISAISYVYVVKNYKKKELDALESQGINE